MLIKVLEGDDPVLCQVCECNLKIVIVDETVLLVTFGRFTIDISLLSLIIRMRVNIKVVKCGCLRHILSLFCLFFNPSINE